MPRKCVVFGCKSGYASCEKTNLGLRFFRFPKDERLKDWISSLPNRFPVGFTPSNNQVICSLHWPPDFETIRCSGNKNGVPKYPPSIFPHVPPSCVPSASKSTRRRTENRNLFAEHRSVQEDELPIFHELDRLPEMLTVADLRGRFQSLIVFEDDLCDLVLLSKVRCGPIYSFQVILTNDGVLKSCYMKTDLVKIPFLQRSKLSS